MVITDGYNRYRSLGRLRIAYRPAAYLERVEVMKQLKHLRSMSVVLAAIGRHLLGSNIPVDGMTADEKEAVFHLCMNWTSEGELDDARNLRDGVRLATKHKRYAQRDCADCLKYWYDESDGTIVMQNGEPVPRPFYVKTLCQLPQGCPKGTPENPNTLSPKNQVAWKHFQQCEASRHFPDDAIVARNSRIIRKALGEKP